VPVAQLAQLVADASREPLVAAFRQLGFSAVSLDLEGLVSGKLNRDHLEAANRWGQAPAPPA
jgi:uncharacterized protein